MKSKKTYKKERTTFDRRIHQKTAGKPGFGLRKDAVLNNKGEQLKVLFDTWNA
jgi:hypothetical protein